MKKIKKHTKDIVGAGVMLGAGSMVLGSMGQGAIANKIATPAGNMLGVAATAGMGLGIMNMVNTGTKKLNKKSKKRGY